MRIVSAQLPEYYTVIWSLQKCTGIENGRAGNGLENVEISHWGKTLSSDRKIPVGNFQNFKTKN